MLKQTGLVLTALCLILSSWLVSARELSGPAPDFTLTTREGETVQLADLKGKVVMINFWASWCAPCRQEMPFLDEMYKDFSRAGFVLLGVNLDQNSAAAEKFLADVPVTFPVLMDPKGDVAKLYNNRAMPSSFFVDREGQLAYLHMGYRPGEEEKYRQTVRKLLAR